MRIPRYKEFVFANINGYEYRAMPINESIYIPHPSFLEPFSWTGVWNSLTTAQKMIAFRFLIEVENSEIESI